MIRSLLLAPLVGGLLATSVAAQDNSALIERMMGLSPDQFDKLFSQNLKQRSVTRDKRTPEIRLFLTEEENVVRGEMVLGGQEGEPLVLELEDGPVTFADNGKDGDRERGDGVFSARFKMDVNAEWATLRRELAGSVAVLSRDSDAKFMATGARSVVPLGEGLDRMFRNDKELAEGARSLLEQSAKLLVIIVEFCRCQSISTVTKPLFSSGVSNN